MTTTTILSELIDEQCWEGVLARLTTHPPEASEPVTRGGTESLPLHEACRLDPPADVIRALVSAHRPAVRVRTRWQYLPLHVAARSSSARAVGALLEAYPRAARLKDQMGKLPVTLATEFGSSAEVVEKLLTIYPEGMFVRDSDGKGPMDYARGKGSRRVMAAMERGRVYCAVSKAGEFFNFFFFPFYVII